MVFVLFFRVRFRDDTLLVLLALRDEVGENGRHVHLDHHAALLPVLAMTVAHREEVLVICLAQVGSQNEVILVLFIDVVGRVPFSGRVRESCNDIALNQLDRTRSFVFLKFKRVGLGVLDAVVIVYSLLEQ